MTSRSRSLHSIRREDTIKDNMVLQVAVMDMSASPANIRRVDNSIRLHYLLDRARILLLRKAMVLHRSKAMGPHLRATMRRLRQECKTQRTIRQHILSRVCQYMGTMDKHFRTALKHRIPPKMGSMHHHT